MSTTRDDTSGSRHVDLWSVLLSSDDVGRFMNAWLTLACFGAAGDPPRHRSAGARRTASRCDRLHVGPRPWRRRQHAGCRGRRETADRSGDGHPRRPGGGHGIRHLARRDRLRSGGTAGRRRGRDRRPVGLSGRSGCFGICNGRRRGSRRSTSGSATATEARWPSAARRLLDMVAQVSARPRLTDAARTLAGVLQIDLEAQRVAVGFRARPSG